MFEFLEKAFDKLLEHSEEKIKKELNENTNDESLEFDLKEDFENDIEAGAEKLISNYNEYDFETINNEFNQVMDKIERKINEFERKFKGDGGNV